MKVVAFAGYSGAGKTTLIEQIIVLLRQQGLRVSVVKHAGHGFDMDHPGKDSHRHREAGAFEVIMASPRRLALLREFELDTKLSVHALIAQLYDGVDWVLVEGYRDSDLLKIEVWRSAAGKAARYTHDDFVTAIATDSPAELPAATGLPVLDLNQPQQVLDWLLSQGDRFEYQAELYQ